MLHPLLASIASVYNFFHQGGFFMLLLLICSVVSLAVIILRGVALRRESIVPAALEKEIEELQPGDDAIVKLARSIRSSPSPLARIAQVGLQHLQWPKAETVEAVQTRARNELVRLESGLFILEIIVGIAPLLGLLGAVSGLVVVFANLGDSATASDPRGIARGISEALSTTIVGLAIAIPSLIAWSYYSRKIETVSAEMEALISELLAKCYHQKEKRAALAALRRPLLSPEEEDEENRLELP
jgi:biopolymer transport protein ExbB